MEWKIFGTAFLTLFLAELGDKTQLAVIMLSSKTESKLAVFLGASAALVLVSLIAVLVGGRDQPVVLLEVRVQQQPNAFKERNPCVLLQRDPERTWTAMR